MKSTLAPLLLPFLATAATAQVKHTSIPLGDALSKATAISSLTAPGDRPFHIRITVSEPDNPQSPYQGLIEEWWSSPEKWRREVTDKSGLKQVIVFNTSETEQDVGSYFPLWLRNFVTAAFDPVPNAAAWNRAGSTVDQVTMPNGAKTDACVRATATIGVAPHTTNAFLSLCFDPQGHLGSYISPQYSMEFHDYQSFGNKQVPRKLTDNPEPGTALLGAVSLEDLSKVSNAEALFTPLDRNDDRFQSFTVNSATMEQLRSGAPAITWPPVHSGNIHGRLSLYVSADADGNVREAWPLNSDNAGLQDPARDQVRGWKLKPATNKKGDRVQVDGPIVFSFDTAIGDPLPELNDAETRALATNAVEPKWPAGALSSGKVVDLQVSVDEKGKLAGMGYRGVPPEAVGPVTEAIGQWTFKPLIRDGKPRYFHGTVRFVVP